jgi:type I restriction enzyme M protein
LSNPKALVQKLWNYCNILRDDGLSYGDYVEQSKPSFSRPSPIPQGFSWPALLKLDGDDLKIHYRHTLEELGNLMRLKTKRRSTVYHHDPR